MSSLYVPAASKARKTPKSNLGFNISRLRNIWCVCCLIPNGFCESFNGRMRDELLNESLFLGLDHARARIATWVADYNQRRPHSALGYLTPAAYAANLSATGGRLRNPDQLRRPPVASPAPHGVKSAEALINAG
jgi:putative transposase